MINARYNENDSCDNSSFRIFQENELVYFFNFFFNFLRLLSGIKDGNDINFILVKLVV
jgi:hypothetical protein